MYFELQAFICELAVCKIDQLPKATSLENIKRSNVWHKYENIHLATMNNMITVLTHIPIHGRRYPSLLPIKSKTVGPKNGKVFIGAVDLCLFCIGQRINNQ